MKLHIKIQVVFTRWLSGGKYHWWKQASADERLWTDNQSVLPLMDTEVNSEGKKRASGREGERREEGGSTAEGRERIRGKREREREGGRGDTPAAPHTLALAGVTGGSQRQFANHVLRRTPPCHSDGRVSALACLTPSGRCSPISPCLREACCGAPRGTRSFHYFISGSCVCCSSLLPVIFFCGFISFFFLFLCCFYSRRSPPPSSSSSSSSILLLLLLLFAGLRCSAGVAPIWRSLTGFVFWWISRTLSESVCVWVCESYSHMHWWHVILELHCVCVCVCVCSVLLNFLYLRMFVMQVEAAVWRLFMRPLVVSAFPPLTSPLAVLSVRGRSGCYRDRAVLIALKQQFSSSSL